MSKFTKLELKKLDEIASRQEVVLPFADDNPERQAKRIAKVQCRQSLWASFNFFAKTYFPHVAQLDFAPVHRYMFSIVEGYSGLTGITGFRGLGKSAMFGFIYPVWKIIRGETYVIYGAANELQSSEKIDFLAHEFENNKRLLKDFPVLQIKEKSDNLFYLQNNVKIRALGIKQAFRGTINPRKAKRPGLIILDDIDEETNVGNMTIGKRKLDKIMQEVRGALAPGNNTGKVLWLGNLVHPNFAICQFKEKIVAEMKSASGTGNIVRADLRVCPSDLDVASRVPTDLGRHAGQPVQSPYCLFGDEKRLIQIPIESRNKVSLWESQYPTSKLPQIRAALGMVGYQREMLGIAILDGTIFKANWFTTGAMPADSDFGEVWVYLDPAYGMKGCYRSVFAVGTLKSNRGSSGAFYYVIKVWCRQCENSRMFDYLWSLFHELRDRFGYRVRFSYEANFGQTRIMSDFDNWCEKQGLMKVSHNFRPVFNRENKNLRIEALEPAIESGKFLFPDGQDMNTVIGQFTSYPQGYIDAPDALAGCLERFSGYSHKKGYRVRGAKYG